MRRNVNWVVGRVVICALVMVVTGCGLFKSTTKTTRKDYQLSQQQLDLKLSAQLDRSGSFSMIDSGRDTSSKTYRILLWPKGSFSFSPEMGFVGEAEKIEISGTLEQIKEYSAMMDSRAQEKAIVKADVTESGKQVAEQSDTVVSSSYSWKWLVAGLVLMGLAVVWVWRRYL